MFQQADEVHSPSTLPSQVSDSDTHDDITIDTYDYNILLKPSASTQIPSKVRLQDSGTDNTVLTDSINPMSFLSAASNKALPKYSAKA